MLFCEVDDVSINEDFSKSLYLDFLRTRYDSLKEKLISNLSLQERLSNEDAIVVESENLTIAEDLTFSQPVSRPNSLSDLNISPTSTFFTFGFNIPVADQDPFISFFNLSRDNLRVPIEIKIGNHSSHHASESNSNLNELLFSSTSGATLGEKSAGF